MVLRLCLKDKSSVLIDGNFNDICNKCYEDKFVAVINHNTKKEELYNVDYIWCVRQSSEV